MRPLLPALFGLTFGALMPGAGAQAACDVKNNCHQGKVGVLTLAPEEGLGVRDAEKRERHLTAINRFRGV